MSTPNDECKLEFDMDDCEFVVRSREQDEKLENYLGVLESAAAELEGSIEEFLTAFLSPKHLEQLGTDASGKIVLNSTQQNFLLMEGARFSTRIVDALLAANGGPNSLNPLNPLVNVFESFLDAAYEAGEIVNSDGSPIVDEANQFRFKESSPVQKAFNRLIEAFLRKCSKILKKENSNFSNQFIEKYKDAIDTAALDHSNNPESVSVEALERSLLLGLCRLVLLTEVMCRNETEVQKFALLRRELSKTERDTVLKAQVITQLAQSYTRDEVLPELIKKIHNNAPREEQPIEGSVSAASSIESSPPSSSAAGSDEKYDSSSDEEEGDFLTVRLSNGKTMAEIRSGDAFKALGKSYQDFFAQCFVEDEKAAPQLSPMGHKFLRDRLCKGELRSAFQTVFNSKGTSRVIDAPDRQEALVATNKRADRKKTFLVLLTDHFDGTVQIRVMRRSEHGATLGQLTPPAADTVFFANTVVNILGDVNPDHRTQIDALIEQLTTPLPVVVPVEEEKAEEERPPVNRQPSPPPVVEAVPAADPNQPAAEPPSPWTRVLVMGVAAAAAVGLAFAGQVVAAICAAVIALIAGLAAAAQTILPYFAGAWRRQQPEPVPVNEATPPFSSP